MQTGTDGIQVGERKEAMVDAVDAVGVVREVGDGMLDAGAVANSNVNKGLIGMAPQMNVACAFSLDRGGVNEHYDAC